MNAQEDAFVWREDDSRHFIEYAQFFVPDREEQLRIIAELAAPTDATGHVIDLCCGDGAVSSALLERCKGITVHGYDGSPLMLQRARENLARFGERFKARAFDISAADWHKLPQPLQAVVSSLAIHHLDAPDKQRLFQVVAPSLVPGGVFIVADIMLPASAAGRRLWAGSWDEFVRERSLRTRGDLKPFERFEELKWNYYSDPAPDPIDQPSRIVDQLAWLDAAGFVEIDVHWMKAGHAIFSGHRPT
jgi:tRNA (cmo5U34)-methyltransferase